MGSTQPERKVPNVNIREFEIRTPERAVTVVRGIYETPSSKSPLVNMVDAVVSALPNNQSQPAATGYIDGSAARIRIYRYLTSGSGIEFDNWYDASRQPIRSLPGDAWRITRFVYAAPPSGVLGEALLAVAPCELPKVDFSQESGGRRRHYSNYIIDVTPSKPADAPGWTAHFVIKDRDGRALGPTGIHTYYDNSQRAVETALSHAEMKIDAGVTMPEAAS